MVNVATQKSVILPSKLIDGGQYHAMRQMMGPRYETAVALFMEFTQCRIEALQRAIATGRVPETLAPIAGMVKDNAAAIGACYLAAIAQLLEQAAEESATSSETSQGLQQLVDNLETCFSQTRQFFLSTLTH